MFHNYANSATNTGDYPANVPKNGQNNNKRRRLSRKCSTNWPKRSRGLRRARYETRVGSPPDFQLKRVSAPSCLRALRFKRESRSSRKLREFSGKCSKNQPKQQQTPEKKLRQMFHKMAMLNRDAGRPSLSKATLTCPACVNRDAGRPSLNKAKLTCPACVNRDAGRPSLRWKSPGLPT